MNKHVSIIGCGWLGFPLAKHLITKNYKIKGSTTSKNKLTNLKEAGITPYIIELTPESIKGNIKECVSHSNILVLNIPPGLRKNPELNYVKQIENIIPFIEDSQIKKVVFVSSTSVYSDETNFPNITEKDTPNPDSQSGIQLLKVEALLQGNPNFETTIIRFSGLFGDDRHPAKSLSGKTNLKNPEAPINLIHLTDCINIISETIEQDVFNAVFNASTVPHPSKKSYYVSICKALNLPLPEYDSNHISKGKIIDSQKLMNALNYEFLIKL